MCLIVKNIITLIPPAVADSWGRIPFGLLWGHTISIGQFEECLQANYYPQSTTEAAIRGQYCLAKIPLKTTRQNGNHTSYNIQHLKDELSFEIGVCVPHTCKPKQIDVLLKKTIAQLFEYSVDKQVIRDRFCVTKQSTPLQPIDIIAMLVLCNKRIYRVLY